MPVMQKRSPTTKDIALLYQLYKDGQLALEPEFQRNSVWPKRAKAYLIDTILHERPMPLFFFMRGRSAQTGRPTYAVIDGQQRLRAIFEFIEGRFALSESKGESYAGKRFEELTSSQKDQIWNYDVVVDELSQHKQEDVKDIFVRMNKYVVKLSPQELRHAKGSGAFHDFVEDIGKWSFWSKERVFTVHQLRRMRSVEFAAELAILLVEGPQDKKSAVDLYYGEYQKSFPSRSSVEKRLRIYFAWMTSTLTDFSRSRYRKPVDLYALVAALDIESKEGKHLKRLTRSTTSKAFKDFEAATRRKNPTGKAARYVLAASQQTDNITPRMTRIEILAELLRTS